MPPFDEDGNIIEPGQLYIRDSDGEFAAFKGIQPIEFISDCKYDYGAEWIAQDQTINFSMPHKSARVFRKMIHRHLNVIKRRRRRIARMAEKSRRELLKKGASK